MSIDPREYGELEATVKNLNATLSKQVDAIEKLADRVREIEDTLSEAKGGWKVMMWLAGASAAFGSVATWFIKDLLGR